MLLLIAGTLAQRWMGLWPALDMFFSGFILWAGPIPLPGAYILLGTLSISLTLKFLLKSDWSLHKFGINLSHLGAIILLLGGLITAITAKESYMLIPEGEETQFIYSYTARNLVIYEDKTQIQSHSFENIENWNFPDLPFKIEPQYWCENCEILKRAEIPANTPAETPEYSENQPYQGMAQFMAFQSKAPDPQPETNLTGIQINISGSDQDGIYIAFDGMPKPIELTKNNRKFTLVFGKEQTALPFSIALIDFVKDEYTGTTMAREYSSDIIVKDGALEWPTRIEMNEPLRYKGYTFFQSSFEQGPGYEATILAVVENKGWLFPYLGTIIISLGLISHLLIRLYRKRTS